MREDHAKKQSHIVVEELAHAGEKEVLVQEYGNEIDFCQDSEVLSVDDVIRKLRMG